MPYFCPAVKKLLSKRLKSLPKRKFPNPSLHPFLAGVYDSSMVYHEFNPPLTVPVTWAPGNLYGSGSLEFDIDQDSIDDFKLSLSVCNPDSYSVLEIVPDYIPSFRITSLSSWRVLFRDCFYSGLQGFVTYHPSVVKFQPNARIDNAEGFWTNSEKIWGFKPGEGYNASFGFWGTVRGYLALRGFPFHGGFKYGWIHLDITDPIHPRVLRVAYQL